MGQQPPPQSFSAMMPQAKKSNKPAGFDEDLDRTCREFLKNKVPVSNIVFVDEFAKYLPLFNKQMHGNLSDKEKKDLTQEYFGRFSPQHNIYVLTREPDPNGMAHPNEEGKFKIECTIPPTFRRVVTLNDVGAKVPALITAFFNATINQSNPYDKRKELYAKQIAEAIGLGDRKIGHEAEQRSSFNKMEADLLGGNKPTNPDEETRPAPDQPSAGGLQIDW